MNPQPPMLTDAAAEPAERTIQVGDQTNTIVVHAKGQQWVAVVRDGTELVREASGGPFAEFVVQPGEYTVRTDGSLDSVTAEQRDVVRATTPEELLAMAGVSEARLGMAADAATLRVEVEAPERHPVDGMPQVPADGEASCTIRLEKVDAAGERLSGRGHTDEIYLRTTGGLLRALDDNAPVRSLRLRAGQASFRLVSESWPRLVTVHAFAEDPALHAEISVEFV